MALTATRWLREQVRPVRGLLGIGVLAGAAQAILMCLGAWLVAHVLSQAIFAARPLASFWPLVALLPLIAVIRFALSVWQRRTTFEAGACISAQVRQGLT